MGRNTREGRMAEEPAGPRCGSTEDDYDIAGEHAVDWRTPAGLAPRGHHERESGKRNLYKRQAGHGPDARRYSDTSML